MVGGWIDDLILAKFLIIKAKFYQFQEFNLWDWGLLFHKV